MKYLWMLLLAAPLLAQTCPKGQYLSLDGRCLKDKSGMAFPYGCNSVFCVDPACRTTVATAASCLQANDPKPGYGTADATIWDSGGSQSGPSLVSQGDTTLFIFDSSSVRPNTLYVYASSSVNPLLTCKMPTQDTLKDCKLPDGVTLDQLMTAIFQSEQRTGEQWMADVDAANKHTQQCVNIAEKLIGQSRKKKGGK